MPCNSLLFQGILCACPVLRGRGILAPVRLDFLSPGLDINATKKLASHAPGDDVIVRCGVQRDELTAGHGHGGLVEFRLEK